MAEYQCNACGGRFTSPQDGVLYFHVCPPLSVPELIAGVSDGSVRAPKAVQDDVATAKGAVSVDPTQPTAADLARARLATVSMPRAGAVNQNITDTQPQPAGAPPKGQRSPGAGVVQL